MATVTSKDLLSVILEEAQKTGGTIRQAIDTVNSNATKVEESFRRTAEIQKQSADAAATVVDAQQQGRLALESSIQKTALQLGADLLDITGRQAQLAQRYIEARSRQQQALDTVIAKQSINVFKDPIGWLGAQVTVNRDVQEFRSNEAVATLASKTIDETNRLLDSRAQAAARLQSTVTGASANAAVQLARNQVVLQAEESNRQAILANSKAVQDVVSLQGSALQVLTTSFSAVNQQQQVSIALQNLEAAKRAESRQIERMKSDAAAGDYVQSMIVQGYKTLYPTQPQKWEVPNSPKMLALISGKVPLDGELKTAYELGVLNSKIAPDGSSRSLGTSPIEVLKNLQYRPELSPDSEAVVQIYTDTAQTIIASPKYKQLVAAKDVEGANKLVNDAIKEVFTSQAALVKDASNPYYLPSVTQIINQTPALKDFKLSQKVLAPAATAGIDLSNPSTVFGLVVDSVRKGTMNANQAAIELSTIYRQGQRVNIASKQFTNLGIAPLEQYNVKIGTGSMLDDTVNMASPTEIIRAMMKANVMYGITIGSPMTMNPGGPVPLMLPR
jgi:hypothetical protein